MKVRKRGKGRGEDRKGFKTGMIGARRKGCYKALSCFFYSKETQIPTEPNCELNCELFISIASYT